MLLDGHALGWAARQKGKTQRGVQSSSPEVSKYSSTICLRLDNRYRPHAGDHYLRTSKIVGNPDESGRDQERSAAGETDDVGAQGDGHPAL
jgi:hypothetical protein